MKDLIFLSVAPDDLYFYWQIKLQCENFRKLGIKTPYHVVLFKSFDRKNQHNSIFDKLKSDYPEVQLFIYVDTNNECGKFIQSFGYIPLLRPWCLKKHFAKYTELKSKAVFYIDQDVLFTKYLDFTPFLSDEINYLSWTGHYKQNYNYLNGDYFDTKASEVDPKKKEAFLKADPVSYMAHQVGITKDIIYKNNSVTGGAQYLLKNIDSKFWADVFDSCLFIKLSMHNYNQLYFKGNTAEEKENAGYQAWCADMWAVLWNLWKRGYETQCPREFDFAWATDKIEKLNEVYLYHHAGGAEVKDEEGTHLLFDKRKMEYINNYKTPFEDKEYVKLTSNKFCAHFYAQEILNTT
jgi:hypothetical protein